eukprot:Sspe_Gene.19467::Locus_7104_Transcript_1_3_Confidence_0.500_Length_1827::g.19467::m.19467
MAVDVAQHFAFDVGVVHLRERRRHEILLDDESPSLGRGSQAAFADSTVPPLRAPWAFWVDVWEGAEGREELVHKMQEIGCITSARDFWSCFNNLPLCKIQTGSSLHLMRGGVRPTWEDPLNREGSRLKITTAPGSCTTVDSKLWLDLCLALVGGHFPHSDEICGASFASRWNSKHYASVWVRCHENHHHLAVIRSKLVELVHSSAFMVTTVSNAAAQGSSKGKSVKGDRVTRPAHRRSHSAPQQASNDFVAAVLGDHAPVIPPLDFTFPTVPSSPNTARSCSNLFGGPEAPPTPPTRTSKDDEQSQEANPALRALLDTITSNITPKKPGHRRRHTDTGKEDFIPPGPLPVQERPPEGPPPVLKTRKSRKDSPPVAPLNSTPLTAASRTSSWRSGVPSTSSTPKQAKTPTKPSLPRDPSSSAHSIHQPLSAPFIHSNLLYPPGLTRKQRRAIIFSNADLDELHCPKGIPLRFPHEDGQITTEEFERLCRENS